MRATAESLDEEDFSKTPDDSECSASTMRTASPDKPLTSSRAGGETGDFQLKDRQLALVSRKDETSIQEGRGMDKALVAEKFSSARDGGTSQPPAMRGSACYQRRLHKDLVLFIDALGVVALTGRRFQPAERSERRPEGTDQK